MHWKIIHKKRDIKNRDSMLYSCDSCPGKNGIHEFLISVFKEADDDEVVSFKQWIKNEKFINLATFPLPLMNTWINCAHNYIDKL